MTTVIENHLYSRPINDRFNRNRRVLNGFMSVLDKIVVSASRILQNYYRTTFEDRFATTIVVPAMLKTIFLVIVPTMLKTIFLVV